MSQPAERGGMLPVLSDDPPVLKALMLAAGDDAEVREQIRRAYHGVMEGAQFSPSVMHSILLSAAYKAIIEKRQLPAPSTNGNGVAPPSQLKSTQLKAIEEAIKALPTRAALEAFHTDLMDAIQTGEFRDIVTKLRGEKANKPTHRVAKMLAVAVVLAALGWMLCWVQLHATSDTRIDRIRAEADARVNRIINAQPAELRALTFLKSHGGSLERETVDHPAGEGIVVRHGNLPAPWISEAADKAVVIPIP